MKIVVHILVFATLLSCSNAHRQQPEASSRSVARVGDALLYLDDYNQKFIDAGVIRDSAYYARKTIENWATETLFYQEAMKKLEEDEIQIDKQVQAYKQELINYIYQSRIVEANLDTAISKEEIQEYYDQHRDNFILKENIVKVNYLKVSVKAPGLPKIKRLLFSTNPADAIQLKESAAQNAESFFMNDSTWLFLEDIKKEIPLLRDQPEYSLTAGHVFQFSDEEYYYYLKIKDVKVKNGLSPLNFERQNIVKFILNNRKTQIILQYKQLLLEKARADKSFEMYDKPH